MTDLMILSILITIAAIVFGISVLAYIGYKEKKRQQKYMEDFNKSSIKSFMNGSKNKKWQRASTPKTPSIK